MNDDQIKQTLSDLIQAVQTNDESKVIAEASALLINFLSTQNRIACALEIIAGKA